MCMDCSSTVSAIIVVLPQYIRIQSKCLQSVISLSAAAFTYLTIADRSGFTCDPAIPPLRQRVPKPE